MLEGIFSGSDGAAVAPLIVGVALGVGYLVKLGVDYAKGKPQQELAERRERRDYMAQLKSDQREAETRAYEEMHRADRLHRKLVTHQHWCHSRHGASFEEMPSIPITE